MASTQADGKDFLVASAVSISATPTIIDIVPFKKIHFFLEACKQLFNRTPLHITKAQVNVTFIIRNIHFTVRC